MRRQSRPRSGCSWTVCHSFCIFFMHYYMVKPHVSNFRIITAIFGVLEFLGYVSAETLIPPVLQCGGIQDNLHSPGLFFSSGGDKTLLHYNDVDSLTCLLDGGQEFVLFDKVWNAKILSSCIIYTDFMWLLGHTCSHTDRTSRPVLCPNYWKCSVPATCFSLQWWVTLPWLDITIQCWSRYDQN